MSKVDLTTIETMDQLTIRMLLDAMSKNNNIRSKAAKDLGIGSRRMLQLLNQYGLEKGQP